jgi:poly(A) polymerase
MGANARDGDIDTVVIAPKWVEREKHFFGSLVELLRSNQFVESLYVVQEAIVPLIKFKYKGTFIDMVFAQVLYACQ